MNLKYLAFDTETHLITPGNIAPKVVCLTHSNGIHTDILINPDIEKWFLERLKEVQSGQLCLISHNLSFDLCALMASYPALVTPIFKAFELPQSFACTLVREKLLDISVGHLGGITNEGKVVKKYKYSLQDIASRRLNIDMNKGEDTWRLRYVELENVPLVEWPIEAVDYATNDALIHYQVFQYQEQRKRELNYFLPTEILETRADTCLNLMSAWGMATDIPHTKKVYKESNDLKYGMAQALKDTGFLKVIKKSLKFEEFKALAPEGLIDPLNPPANARELKKLYKEKGVPLPDPVYVLGRDMQKIKNAVELTYPGEPPLTAKGGISTSGETLELCTDPELVKLVEYNRLGKSIGTFIVKFFDSVVHPSYDVLKVTGRTSCYAPNIQQLPRLPGVRECLRARPGCTLIACDYDSQEMRTLAQSLLQIVGHSKMAEKYREDRNYDPHLDFAVNQLIHPSENLTPKQIKGRRQRAKISNFGYAGGMAPETFRRHAKGYGVLLTSQDAISLRDAWIQQFPEMKLYKEWGAKIVDIQDHVTVPGNGFRRGGCTYCQALNVNFQSLAASASKNALWYICRAAYSQKDSPLFGSRPVAFIHDEIIIETPIQNTHEAAKEMEKLMIEAMEVYTPDVPAAATAHAMINWSKEAKAVYNEGRLVPWKMG